MLVKGRQAESFARRPGDEVWAILAFSEDEGLAADAVQAALAAWGGKTPLDVTVLDDDAIRKDPSLLFDALEAVSLLGDPRAVRVRTSGDKIAALLIEAIEAGDTEPGRYAAKLVIETGSLASKSKLRSAAEKAKRTACLQLFAEEAGDIGERVRAALLAEGAVIEDAALDAFCADLPGHRAIANSEIEKLALYARGLGRAVSEDDIRQLTATTLRQDIGGVLIAALDGRPADAHRALDRLNEVGTSPISVLRSLQMETLRMLSAHEKAASGDANPGRSLRPPVWPNEWPAFRKRMNTWTPKRLMRIMERIHDAERQAKTAGPTAEPIVRLLINDLARVAEAGR
ncbi:MAG: DNA polymerase III subunit delta [Acidobacteria bacterium]|jgi:DNA polymerase-3 subunit delta|nr:DNA polymerase III subunit delta [Acidobacteriota bacterium]